MYAVAVWGGLCEMNVRMMMMICVRMCVPTYLFLPSLTRRSERPLLLLVALCVVLCGCRLYVCV